MSRARWRRGPPSRKTTSACRSRRIDAGCAASHPAYCVARRGNIMLRRVGVLAAALGLVTLGLLAANAQDYPSRSIRLPIHTPPGSLVDVLGRLVGQELSQRLGQSIVADNRTGGATMIAVEQLRNSPPD